MRVRLCKFCLCCALWMAFALPGMAADRAACQSQWDWAVASLGGVKVDPPIRLNVTASGWCRLSHGIVALDGLEWRVSEGDGGVQLEFLNRRLDLPSHRALPPLTLSGRMTYDRSTGVVSADPILLGLDPDRGVAIRFDMTGIDLADAAAAQRTLPQGRLESATLRYASIDGFGRRYLPPFLNRDSDRSGRRLSDFRNDAVNLLNRDPARDLPDGTRSALLRFVTALPDADGEFEATLAPPAPLPIAGTVMSYLLLSEVPAGDPVAALASLGLTATWIPAQ